MAYDSVLFPGRPHLLTRFRAAYVQTSTLGGFEIAPGSHGFTNPWWLVARRPAA